MGYFLPPIFERSFQWTRRESKYRLDNNNSNVYSSDNSNNNNGNEVAPMEMAIATQSPQHSSSLTWRSSGGGGGVGSGSFRLAPSSNFFSKMQSPSKQLHHRNHHHHHHHHPPHDDIDDFPVETGYSVVCHDDSSNQPSPRRKLKHAFSSSYLFKSRNRSSRYNLKKKKSTHENVQEVRGLRLLTSTTTGRKESVSTCRIIQGDVLNDEHGSIGILHAKVINQHVLHTCF